MNDLLNALFSLREMGFGDPEVEFGFARPLPGWAWLLVVLGAVGLSAWSYRHLEAGRLRRTALAGLRAVLIVLLVLLVSGPRLVRPNVRVERDWVVVLVDRSASMTVRDVAGAGGDRLSRDERLRRALADAWPAWKELGERKRVLWLGFDAVARELPVGPGGIELGRADGRRTAVGEAVEQALQLVTARPVSAVVIVSDGRSVDEPSRRAMRRLRAERIPVYAVGLGSERAMGDLRLAEVEAPDAAFVEDEVPVRVRVERRAGEGREQRAVVRLTDEGTGLVLEEREVTIPGGEEEPGSAEVTLRVRADEPGSGRWRVTIVPPEADLVEENNSEAFPITLVDRALRVLYLDGYPRWEARYLRNLFKREGSIESSSLLLSSRRQYLQEGDVVLDRLPVSPEEWERFDVVILGDLRSELFSIEQLMQLRDHVAERGAGLLWIGGPSATPLAWADTPLADLLPFRLTRGDTPGASAGAIDASLDPVVMHRAPAADRAGLLDLAEGERAWPRVLTDPENRWAQLWYAQRIPPSRLKPAVETLATFVSAAPGEVDPKADATPAVMSMRFGSGRVVYVATDEIWRWRYGRGETLPERFWIPLIRFQARERLTRSGRPGIIEVAPERPRVRRPAVVRLQLIDQAAVESLPERTRVRIEPLDDDGTVAAEELVLGPAGSPRGRTSTWIPPAAGRYRLIATDPLLAGVSRRVDVVLDDEELRRPETDFPFLTSLATGTGGAFLRASDLGTLPERLPRREVTMTGEPEVEALWDRPVVLAFLLLLAGLEWLGRRLLRLA